MNNEDISSFIKFSFSNGDISDNILGVRDTLTLMVDKACLPVDLFINIYNSLTGIEYELNQAIIVIALVLVNDVSSVM